MTTGRRYGQPAHSPPAWSRRRCRSPRIRRAIARAETMTGKNPATLKAIKRELYSDALTALWASPLDLPAEPPGYPAFTYSARL